MIKQLFELTFKHYIPVLKRGGWTLLLGTFILEIPIQAMQEYQRAVEASLLGMGGAVDTARLVNQVTLLLLETLVTAYILFCASIYTHSIYRNKATELLKVTKETAVPLTVESLRALGKTILGLVLFVLPGFYFYIRLSQVPFVVLFTNAYKSGKADALKMSNFLVMGNGVLVTLFLIITSAINLYVSVLKDSHPPMESPAVFGVCFLFNFLVQVFFCVASYFLFELLLISKKDSLPKE